MPLAWPGLVLAAGVHHRFVRVLVAALIVIVVIGAAALITMHVVRRYRKHGGDSGPGPSSASPESEPPLASVAIAITHLNKTYRMGKVEVNALDDVSLEIPNGGLVCIMGKSGSGKSTLLRQLGLIDRPSSGTIWVCGRQVTQLSEPERAEMRLSSLGYVFQEYALLPELSAHENVYLPAMMLGQRPQQYKRRASDLLDRVGLGPRVHHRPRELSGGEQQRVAIARALVNRPKVIFADEPTANLDSLAARTVMETLQELNRTLQVTVLFVSHDPDDARYATQLIQLQDGKLTGAPR
ncbi:MAG TPA: ATP-binding cassette domain-containing protein [Candidatus Dormibacteraeota bacterium]|nr:ATP-binding cassette domain-containing protein [Candidatus Dormibacteraeota bacterium]